MAQDPDNRDPGSSESELAAQLAELQRKLALSERGRAYVESQKEQNDRVARRVIADLNAAKSSLEQTRDTLEKELSQSRLAESRLRERNTELAAMRDRAEAASNAKTGFLAKMSHELRTPLNAIIGYAELMRDELTDREVEDAIRDQLLPDLVKINGAAQQLMSVINDVLDISRIESGHTEIHLEDFDVRALVKTIEGTITPLAGRNNNRLEVEMDPTVTRIRSDRAKLRQAVLNLLSNACKFTHDGCVSLRMRYRRIVETDWLDFIVRDTGIGIPREKLEGLFDPFRQADASTKSRFGGTGLGLAISREFCRMLGGDITAESVVGEGSTFTIKVPVTLLSRPAIEPKTIELMHDFNRRTVLAIDDDPTSHQLLGSILRPAGYDLYSANNGAEGLRMAEEVLPDIITLDVMMSDMDGWSVLAALKSDSELAAIPVVMVSMLDNPELAETLGADAYLTKPLDRVQLVETITRLCDEAAARRLSGG